MSSAVRRLIRSDFTAAPSLEKGGLGESLVVGSVSDAVEAVGIPVSSDGDVPSVLGLSRVGIEAAGFDGSVGSTLRLPRETGPMLVAVGVGESGRLTESVVRDAAAAFARAADRFSRVALDAAELGSPGEGGLSSGQIAHALTEGALLARYRFSALKTTTGRAPLELLELVFRPEHADDAVEGARKGRVMARTAALARDLANTPASHLTATDLGLVAERVGPEFGLVVDVFDKEKLVDLGCGGLLGVNAGSQEEPRMVVLHYDPVAEDGSAMEPEGRLAFVGKGITYDSGGISLKPSTGMHVLMKMDMAGAAAVFAAMTALGDLGCRASVTGLLMCTDNMPSGSATKLGDVLTIHGGTTVEVKNTDAEGRLVMADALALATEEHPDAVIDIATLTGAAMAALGNRMAALFGNDEGLSDQLRAAARAVDEPLWPLPLEKGYRKHLESDVADLANVGGSYGGAIIAALFLSEFVGATPWAHLDIAGTMAKDADDLWRPKGATGFGARLLAEFAVSYSPPAASRSRSAESPDPVRQR